ncbi:hypothetical protein K1719_017855 [Acacia pycnantha]|nr:hypothetical protein K1719_017855 [Acacia pycnantha]
MMEKELERMKEASQADPSIVVHAPARPPRHQKWKAARMKGDKYINEDVAEVASKIDALEEQSSQGSFTPATRMDILSTAIGKPDYLDAVRGETREFQTQLILAPRVLVLFQKNVVAPTFVPPESSKYLLKRFSTSSSCNLSSVNITSLEMMTLQEVGSHSRYPFTPLV